MGERIQIQKSLFGKAVKIPHRRVGNKICSHEKLKSSVRGDQKQILSFKFSQKNIGENSQNVCYYPLYTLEFVLNKEKPVLLK